MKAHDGQLDLHMCFQASCPFTLQHERCEFVVHESPTESPKESPKASDAAAADKALASHAAAVLFSETTLPIERVDTAHCFSEFRLMTQQTPIAYSHACGAALQDARKTSRSTASALCVDVSSDAQTAAAHIHFHLTDAPAGCLKEPRAIPHTTFFHPRCFEKIKDAKHQAPRDKVPMQTTDSSCSPDHHFQLSAVPTQL